jgi:hypothetical protein
VRVAARLAGIVDKPVTCHTFATAKENGAPPGRPILLSDPSDRTLPICLKTAMIFAPYRSFSVTRMLERQ